MKIIYSAGWGGDAFPFGLLADKVDGVTDPNELEEQDSVLIVWGGADIDPSFYGHKESKRTYTGGWRDKIEWELMAAAIHKGIPIIGVCRGAQMACAASGGFLIQDVSHHGTRHKVVTNDGQKFDVNSLHHQMMFVPEGVDHELLAWCPQRRSRHFDPINGKWKFHYLYQDDQQFVPPEDWNEPEAIYFPKTKALAIQWHPEMMYEGCEATQFIYKQLERLGWLTKQTKSLPTS